MLMQDIIKDILSLIDGLGRQEEPEQVATVVVAHPTATIEKTGQESPFTHAGDDINRWRQIVDLADNSVEPYGNAPKERYADIEAVTTDAGGGMNGPKHPHDIRVKDPSAYPNQQEY